MHSSVTLQSMEIYNKYREFSATLPEVLPGISLCKCRMVNPLGLAELREVHSEISSASTTSGKSHKLRFPKASSSDRLQSWPESSRRHNFNMRGAS